MYASPVIYRPRSRGGSRGSAPPSSPPRFSPSFHRNPNSQNPCFSSSTQIPQFEWPGFYPACTTLEWVESAEYKVRQDLLAAGEHVSSWIVSNRVAIALHPYSWSVLGFNIEDVPSLRALQFVEGQVNTFIHCLVSVRRMTSVNDLGVGICKSQGVQKFEELGLGTILRHPLVQHYFSLPLDVTEVCSITVEDMIAHLWVFIYSHRKNNKELTAVEAFLDFLVEKNSVRARENLGVWILSFGSYIKFIARKSAGGNYTSCS